MGLKEELYRLSHNDRMEIFRVPSKHELTDQLVRRAFASRWQTPEAASLRERRGLLSVNNHCTGRALSSACLSKIGRTGLPIKSIGSSGCSFVLVTSSKFALRKMQRSPCRAWSSCAASIPLLPLARR